MGRVGHVLGTIFLGILGLIVLVVGMSPEQDRPEAGRQTADTTLGIAAIVLGSVKHAIPNAIGAYRQTAQEPGMGQGGAQPRRRDGNPNRPGIQPDANPNRPGFQTVPRR